MNWLFWFLIAWFALTSLATIALIGRPKAPTTPGGAVITVLINLVLVACVLIGWPR